MKCEKCHVAEVTTVLRVMEAGEPRELFVCDACAKRADVSRSTSQAGESRSDQAEPGGEHAASLLGMIVDATFEVVGQKGLAHEPSCPVCGMRRSEYRKRARLGCPACYEAFAVELEAALLDLHRAVRHIGKRPADGRVTGTRQAVQEAMAAAVRAQRYEEASTLRDALRQMDETKRDASGGGA